MVKLSRFIDWYSEFEDDIESLGWEDGEFYCNFSFDFADGWTTVKFEPHDEQFSFEVTNHYVDDEEEDHVIDEKMFKILSELANLWIECGPNIRGEVEECDISV